MDSDGDALWDTIDNDGEPIFVGDTSTQKNPDKVGVSAGATSTDEIPVKVKGRKPVPNSDTSDSKDDTKSRKPIVSNPCSVGDSSTQKNADKVGVSAGATSTDEIPVKVIVRKPVPISDTSDSKNDTKDRQTIVRKRKCLTKTDGAESNKPESPAQKRWALPLKRKCCAGSQCRLNMTVLVQYWH
jgi:hypothetical protein